MSEKLIVIVGPSGVGKTKISEKIEKRMHLKNVISSTTRDPRPGEVDGREYHFFRHEEFQARVDRGEFVEFVEYKKRLYGTRYEDLDHALSFGGLVMLVVEINGARAISRIYPQAQTFFITAPIDALIWRLNERDMDEIERQERIETLPKELLDRKDPCIRNVIDNLDGRMEEAVQQICDIVERRTRHPIGRV